MAIKAVPIKGVAIKAVPIKGVAIKAVPIKVTPINTLTILFSFIWNERKKCKKIPLVGLEPTIFRLEA